MTYQPTKFQLTKLLQNAWQKMGQLRTWKVTGGSTTTFVNSAWAGVEDTIYEDDDAALIYGTAVVVRDAAGANAAPEGEFGEITDYDSSTYTATIDAITSAIGSGDTIGIASPLFPLQDMIQLANNAIRGLGEIDLVDTSLSISSSVTEYTLPSTIRQMPVRVSIQDVLGSTGNNQWIPINFRVIPATAGSNWTLVVPHQTQGATLQVVYRAPHPELTAFDSDIADVIHPKLATAALVAEAFQWYNNMLGGSNQYFLQRENKALQDLQEAKVEYPILRDPGTVRGMPHWNNMADYVSLTSDLRA